MIASARAVADAVLYEGFLLFPYAKSALKNRMPFQFGVVMPQGYPDATEPPYVRSQFVLCDVADDIFRLEGLLRFLQVADEPSEREVDFVLTELAQPHVFRFDVGGLAGKIDVWSERLGSAWVVTVQVENTTRSQAVLRSEALPSAFVSAHIALETSGGVFASLLDPPQAALDAVARCKNERLFPVLVGESEAQGNTSNALLISPIILYDFPRIAPASRARTFDGTEIDELLMLSVASLTDDEKREARSAHPYVRELLERAEALDADTQRSLHGELTGGFGAPGNEQVVVDGVTIGRGSRVRVEPKRRADVFDDLVRGMTGRVNAVHTDFEGKRYVGVIFDGDPAGELHDWYGRSFFYEPDEVQPV